MKLVFTSVFLFAFFVTLHSQDLSKEFGVIGTEEIEFKRYAKDRNAEAVVMFDIGKSYFIRDHNIYDVVFERITRIKILKNPGTRWAEVEIPFYQKGGIAEKVTDIVAYTYNFENGGIYPTTFNVDNVYEEKKNNNWSIKKFALPNVKEGSIIEYRYKIISPYLFNLQDWNFQWKIPVIYSLYEARITPFYEYVWLLQGAKQFDIFEEYEDKSSPVIIKSLGPYGDLKLNEMVYKFGMKDIPAFNDEEFITSWNDYVVKIDFQLAKIHHFDGKKFEIITTWPDLIKELSKDKSFGSYVSKSKGASSKILKSYDLAQKTDREKFDVIVGYVKNSFRWNGNNGYRATKTPKKFVSEKHGNSADINLFTVGMLNKAGIEAYPLLISTRNHGKIKQDYPFAHFFNYVLIYAELDGDVILSDATELFTLNDRIPARCINDKGLIINRDKTEWADLRYTVPSEKDTRILIDFDDDLKLRSDITLTATEYDAAYYRSKFTGNHTEILRSLHESGYNDIDAASVEISNQSDKSKPYLLRYVVSDSPEFINQKLYISPFQNEVIADNPLKQTVRTYPVDLTYPVKRKLSATLIIPKGFRVDLVPEDKVITNELFDLNYDIFVDEEKVVVTMKYYFKHAVYSPSNYSKVRSYFNDIVKKGNEKLVLSKIMVADE
jgi:hypothetical protein